MVLQVKNGITITKNENGSITLNGTATEGFTVFSFPINLALKAGTYTHSITNMVNGIFLSFDNTNTTMISSNKTGTNPFKTFTLTEDTVFKKYHMWVDRGTTLNNLTIFPMLCGGTGTAYKSYIKPQLYVRNSNGVYEEFTKKSEEAYSTEEQKIGTWIEGKTLYRKVVDLGNLPNATSKAVSTGLTNVNYIKSYGMMTNGSIYFEMNNTRPTDNTTNNETGLYINNNTIYIETKIDRSSYTGFVILEYIKTTD